jgi:thimet oligopeptidase
MSRNLKPRLLRKIDKMKNNIFKKCCVGMMVIKLLPTSVVDIEKRTDLAIDEAKKSINAIMKLNSKERTFSNSAAALDEALRKFRITQSSLWLVKNVYPETARRDAAQKSILKMSTFAIDTFESVDLYKAFNDYCEGPAKKESLNSEQKYYLEEVSNSFKRSGLHLPSDKLKKVKDLQKKLSELSLEFSKNVASENRSLSVSESDLLGVDAELIKGLKRDSSGKCIVTTDYPTYFGIMKHCSVSSTRRDLFRLFNNRAYPKNKELLEKIIACRDKVASLLGFSSYTSYDVDNQMAKSETKVDSFLTDLKSKVVTKESKEIKMLLSDLPSDVVIRDGKFEPWDLSYAKEAYIEKHYDLDDRKVAEYFPVEKTINGIFAIYQEFLGLKFKILNENKLWHKDVSLVEIRQKDNNKLEGYLLLDLYPRDGKYRHACCESIVSPCRDIASVTVVIANFPKLLKHSDVTTFFHEFGHAMHNLLGRSEMNWFAGYNTKNDFVEVPSQMFEEWMWDKEMLKKVSSHYKTGEPLPDKMIEKMVELKNITSGSFVHRQCTLSRMACEYFETGESKDVDKIFRDIWNRESLGMHTDTEDHFYASFEHLDGYGAKYYCYMWSLVYALDLFDTISKNGLLDNKIGKKLISCVLGRGGSVDPNILLKDFLGREPSQDAFLKSIGV